MKRNPACCLMTALLLALVLFLCACGGKSENTMEGTKGLTYAAYNGSYYVTGYTGSEADIIIPDTYNNVPVTGVSESAFEGSDIQSVIFGGNIAILEKGAFANASLLTSVTFTSSEIELEDNAFVYCVSLNTINLEGNAYFSSIEYAAFAHCTSLETIELHEGVSRIEQKTFLSCSALTSVTIPDSVTNIDVSAFSGCTGLTDVYYSGSESDWAAISMKGGNECLTGATIHYNGEPSPEETDTQLDAEDSEETASGTCGDNLTWALDADGVLTISGTGDMKDLTAGSVWNWKSIASVVFSDGVTSIGERAFLNCTGLTSVTIPDSVTSIGGLAFYGCTGLTSVTIPDSVTSIGGLAFYGCTGLTSVTIPDSVTSIDECAFEGCTGLTSVTIGSGVTSIGDYAFQRCTGLTNVTIPANVAEIGVNPFIHCSSLAKIQVSAGNTAFCSVNGILFSKDMTRLISYPAGKTVMFYVIPDSVTSISEAAFFDIGLTDITIGGSVTSICDYAFHSCTNLANVYYSGSESDWAAISIGESNEYLTEATIHYNSD